MLKDALRGVNHSLATCANHGEAILAFLDLAGVHNQRLLGGLLRCGHDLLDGLLLHVRIGVLAEAGDFALVFTVVLLDLLAESVQALLCDRVHLLARCDLLLLEGLGDAGLELGNSLDERLRGLAIQLAHEDGYLAVHFVVLLVNHAPVRDPSSVVHEFDGGLELVEALVLRGLDHCDLLLIVAVVAVGSLAQETAGASLSIIVAVAGIRVVIRVLLRRFVRSLLLRLLLLGVDIVLLLVGAGGVAVAGVEKARHLCCGPVRRQRKLKMSWGFCLLGCGCWL